MQQLDFTFSTTLQRPAPNRAQELVPNSEAENAKQKKLASEKLKQRLKQKLEQEPAGRSRRRSLENNIAKHVQGPLKVEMHDNRRVMISSRRRKGVQIIRLHHMFLQADDRTIRAIARFCSKPDTWSKAVVNDFIESHGHLVSADNKSFLPNKNIYKFHNLIRIFKELNQQYFSNQVQADIAYGKAGTPKRRRRRSILLGSYEASSRQITIHPALDQRMVPRVYVAYVVFHEMLHQFFPSRREAGRTIIHGPEFRQAERKFAGRREALLWFKKNEDTILGFKAKPVKKSTRNRG